MSFKTNRRLARMTSPPIDSILSPNHINTSISPQGTIIQRNSNQYPPQHHPLRKVEQMDARRQIAIDQAQSNFRCSKLECFMSDTASLNPPIFHRSQAQAYLQHEEVTLVCTYCGAKEETTLTF